MKLVVEIPSFGWKGERPYVNFLASALRTEEMIRYGESDTIDEWRRRIASYRTTVRNLRRSVDAPR